MKFGFLGALIATVAGSAPLRGAIMINGPGAGAPNGMIITEDIVLTISSDAAGFQGSLRFVLDDWLPANSGIGTVQFSQPFSMYLNGGAAYAGYPLLIGSWGVDQGSMSGNDSCIVFSFPAEKIWQRDETFGLRAGYYPFSPNPGFQAAYGRTFTGNVFLANNAGQRVSALAAVPETGVPGLVLIGLCGAFLRRR